MEYAHEVVFVFEEQQFSVVEVLCLLQEAGYFESKKETIER